MGFYNLGHADLTRVREERKAENRLIENGPLMFLFLSLLSFSFVGHL